MFPNRQPKKIPLRHFDNPIVSLNGWGWGDIIHRLSNLTRVRDRVFNLFIFAQLQACRPKRKLQCNH